jgi:outer membrane lipoprotein
MSIKRHHVLSFVLAMAAMLLLAGCAHVISKEVLQEVDASLTFAHVSKDPEAYKGKTVLFGGDIIETQNLSDKTQIVVLQRPLGSRGEPSAGDVSEGRFIITTPGFLDPAIYGPGRKITVAGTVVGKEVRPLGESIRIQSSRSVSSISGPRKRRHPMSRACASALASV